MGIAPDLNLEEQELDVNNGADIEIINMEEEINNLILK